MSKQPGRGATGVRRLSGVGEGECVRLLGVEAGVGLKSHLAAMGLVPGAEVRMLKNAGRGPVVVMVKDTRLALGRGMAAKMQVE